MCDVLLTNYAIKRTWSVFTSRNHKIFHAANLAGIAINRTNVDELFVVGKQGSANCKMGNYSKADMIRSAIRNMTATRHQS